MKERKYYFAILRVSACLAVIIIHVSSDLVTSSKILFSSKWWIAHIYDSIARWAVPIFIMMSGALLLDKNRKTDLKNRLLRIMIPTVFWGIFYYMYNLIVTHNMKSFSIVIMIKSILNGKTYYHLWYLYTLIGLYLALPIIKTYINSATKRNIEYFLFLSFIASAIFPLILKFFTVKIGIDVSMVGLYVGYFVLGYYLDNFEISNANRKVIWVSGFIGLSVTILGSAFLSNKSGKFEAVFYGNDSITVVLMATSIFTFAKYFCNRVQSKLEQISVSTFGIYLIHAFVLSQLKVNVFGIKIYNRFGNPLLDIPLAVLVIFLTSYLITEVLRKIRYISKVVS